MYKLFIALFDCLTECRLTFALIVMFAYGSASTASADESRNNAEHATKDEMMFYSLVMWDDGAPENSINIPSGFAKLEYCNEAGENISADVHATTGRVRKWLCRVEITNNKELISYLKADIKRRDNRNR